MYDPISSIMYKRVISEQDGIFSSAQALDVCAFLHEKNLVGSPTFIQLNYDRNLH